MRRVLFIGFFLILSGIAHAETRYVSGVLDVTLRTGKGTSHKVISMVRSGQPLQLIEAGPQWSMVRAPNGKEGWMLSRFVTTDKPDSMLLARLREKYDRLSEQYRSLKEGGGKLVEENGELKKTLAEKTAKLDEVTKAFASLKKRSADFFALEKDYKESASELERQTEKAELLEDRLGEKNIRWFLSGAGVLLAGILIGHIAKRKKRTSYYGI